MIFHEPKCLKPDSSCKCAYVQCGHIRDLYFWPCENWYNFGCKVFSLCTKKLNFNVKTLQSKKNDFIKADWIITIKQFNINKWQR